MVNCPKLLSKNLAFLFQQAPGRVVAECRLRKPKPREQRLGCSEAKSAKEPPVQTQLNNTAGYLVYGLRSNVKITSTCMVLTAVMSRVTNMPAEAGLKI